MMPYRFKDFWGFWCIEGSETPRHAQNVVDTVVPSTAREMLEGAALGLCGMQRGMAEEPAGLTT
jgi:hypothetical protein